MTYQVKCKCGKIIEVDDIPTPSYKFYANLDKNATCCKKPNYHIYFSEESYEHK